MRIYQYFQRSTCSLSRPLGTLNSHLFMKACELIISFAEEGEMNIEGAVTKWNAEHYYDISDGTMRSRLERLRGLEIFSRKREKGRYVYFLKPGCATPAEINQIKDLAPRREERSLNMQTDYNPAIAGFSAIQASSDAAIRRYPLSYRGWQRCCRDSLGGRSVIYYLAYRKGYRFIFNHNGQFFHPKVHQEPGGSPIYMPDLTKPFLLDD